MLDVGFVSTGLQFLAGGIQIVLALLEGPRAAALWVPPVKPPDLAEL